MTSIIGMSKEQLDRLTVEDVPEPFTAEEFMHITTAYDAAWWYDYPAARAGIVGLHALLKSGWHSDGFIASGIFLMHENIMEIIAHQMVMQIRGAGLATPDYVVGVPNGATDLAANVAQVLGTTAIRMEKVDGRMILDAEIPDPEGTRVLCVEDLCTKGTGCKEAIREIAREHPFVNFVPFIPVILNRGDMEIISVAGVGRFTILPIAEKKILDWDPAVFCPLCEEGSEAIAPKASGENWQRLVTSQLA